MKLTLAPPSTQSTRTSESSSIAACAAAASRTRISGFAFMSQTCQFVRQDTRPAHGEVLIRERLRMPTHRPVMLVILDGWGWREERADNAVLQANTPTFDRIWAMCPHALLHTSGKDVGLPEGQMGNSEVGHLNIGAGRVVMQELPRIGLAIQDGSLAQTPALAELIEALRKSGGTCHLMGLISPGCVHSHQDHAVALARILANARIPIAVHAFTDGRATPPQSGAGYLQRLRQALPEGATIATVSGRYYAMDRDHRWE